MDPELGELMCAWVGGAVPTHRRDSLLRRLRADEAFRLAFVEEVRLLGMLKVVRSNPPRWLRLEDLFGWSADEGRAAPKSLADAVAARISALPLPDRRPAPAAPARRSWSLVAILLVGTLAVVVPVDRPRPGEPARREGVAVAVRLAGAEWAGNNLSEGGVVEPGPLVLRKGTAKLAFRNGVTAHVEGPADIDVVSETGVFCHRGRVRLEVPPGATGFTAAAPGACVVGTGVDYELTVAEDRSEVMVFGGRPVVSVLARAPQPGVPVKAGEFVRFDPRAGRMFAPTPKVVAPPVPAGTPPLSLDPGYAKAVLADRPAGYWRFESKADGVCPNEIRGGPGFRLIGFPSLYGPAGENQSLYFSASALGGPHGALSDGAWKPTGKEFAIECWIMPRMFQQGAVLGVLADVKRDQFDLHAALVELTGSTAPGPNAARRVRGLYRVPVGRASGTECLSETTYRALQWFHMVAQRRGDEFELYVNGEVVAKGSLEGAGAIPQSRLLIGALYASRDGKSCTGRPFAGAVDEVAVYDHPLTPADVLRHYRLGPARK